MLREMMAESPEFDLMVKTPGIDPDAKNAAIEAICGKVGSDPAVINFLKVLTENKRMILLPRMIDLFETFYRAEKMGEMVLDQSVCTRLERLTTRLLAPVV